MSNISIGKSALFLTASKVISLSVSFFATMFLSRSTTLQEYGTYSQLLMIINMFTTLFSVSFPNSLNYFLGKTKKTEVSNFLSTYYTVSTAIGILEGIILVCLLPIFSSFFSNEYISKFAFFLGSIPWTVIIISSVENVLIIYNKIMWLTVYKIVYSFLVFAAILAKYIFSFSFEIYLFCYTAIQIFAMVMVLFMVKKIEKGLEVRIKSEILKEVSSYCVPLGISAILSSFNIYLDQIMIGKLMGVEAAALYYNAGRELPFTIISSSITAVLLPKMVVLFHNKKYGKALEIWKASIILVYIIFCFCTCGLIVFSTQIVTILYSSKYLPAVTIFRIYSVVLLLRITYFGTVLNCTGKTKLIMYSSLLSLGVNLFLNIFLFYLMGFIGPAIATLVSIASINCFQLFYTGKILKIKFKKIFPWYSLLQITEINVIFSFSIYICMNRFVKNLSLNNYIAFAVFGTIWLIGYFVFMKKRIKESWEILNQKN